MAHRTHARCPPSLGRYVSIWALPGTAAEFDLLPLLLDPPDAPDVFSCSRFSGFCPMTHYHSGYTVGERATNEPSAAPHRARDGRATALALAASASAAAAMLCFRPRR